MIYNAKKMEDMRAYAKREVFQDTIMSAYSEKKESLSQVTERFEC